MGLQATIQAAVVTAFEAVGDLVATVVLTRQVTGAYDAATGDVTMVESSYEFEAIVDEVMEGASTSGGQRATGGAEVETVSAKVYMKPGDVDPVRGDVLRINETKYRVLKSEPLKPDGKTVLLWQLEVGV